MGKRRIKKSIAKNFFISCMPSDLFEWYFHFWNKKKRTKIILLSLCAILTHVGGRRMRIKKCFITMLSEISEIETKKSRVVNWRPEQNAELNILNVMSCFYLHYSCFNPIDLFHFSLLYTALKYLHQFVVYVVLRIFRRYSMLLLCIILYNFLFTFLFRRLFRWSIHAHRLNRWLHTNSERQHHR